LVFPCANPGGRGVPGGVTWGWEAVCGAGTFGVISHCGPSIMRRFGGRRERRERSRGDGPANPQSDRHVWVSATGPYEAGGLKRTSAWIFSFGAGRHAGNLGGRGPAGPYLRLFRKSVPINRPHLLFLIADRVSARSPRSSIAVGAGGCFISSGTTCTCCYSCWRWPARFTFGQGEEGGVWTGAGGFAGPKTAMWAEEDLAPAGTADGGEPPRAGFFSRWVSARPEYPSSAGLTGEIGGGGWAGTPRGVTDPDERWGPTTPGRDPGRRPTDGPSLVDDCSSCPNQSTPEGAAAVSWRKSP